MKLSRSLLASSTVHVLLVLLVVVVPALIQFFTRPKRKELLTYVDLRMAAPPSASVSAVPESKPLPPKPPEPDKSKDIPEPVKKKPEIKKSETKIKRPEPRPQTPPLTPQEIKKLLAKDLPVSALPNQAGEPSEFAWYFAQVRERMYLAWAQPGDLPGAAGLSTEVLIRVQRDGAIARTEMVRSSGNSIMDDSVMKAVNSVSRLQALPPEISGLYKDITIEFELSKAAL